MIGGCCGTTPTEIAAIARAVEEERQPTAPFSAAERELVVAAHERPEETELAQKLGAGEWVTCVELDNLATATRFAKPHNEVYACIYYQILSTLAGIRQVTTPHAISTTPNSAK